LKTWAETFVEMLTSTFCPLDPPSLSVFRRIFKFPAKIRREFSNFPPKSDENFQISRQNPTRIFKFPAKIRREFSNFPPKSDENFQISRQNPTRLSL
jgi:hypothetical protein